MIRAMIVDDEKPARDELRWLLEKERDIEVCCEAVNGMEALKLAESGRPDLILLDIQMPGLSGLETARQLIALHHFPQIIFVTAYDQFAIEAFDVNAVDYLLKPIEQDRLDRALCRVRNRLKGGESDLEEKILKLLKPLSTGIYTTQTQKKITVYYEGHFKPIDVDDILMITADGKQSLIYTQEAVYSYRTSLRDLEQLLSGVNLFKCHRSYSLNLKYIEFVEPWFNSAYRVKLKGVDALVPVSRTNTPELKKLLSMD